MSMWIWVSSDSFRMFVLWLVGTFIWDRCNWLHCVFSCCTPLCLLWFIELMLSWFWNCCSRLVLLVDLHYGSYMAMAMEVKMQARRTEKSVHDTERQVHAKLFLQERDHWHESGMHQEYVLGKMLCSAEYAGVKERWHQSMHCVWQGWSQTKIASEVRWNTTFEHLGHACNWELILHLVDSVYLGLTSIGQSRLQPDTMKHVVAKIKEVLMVHIRLERVPQACTRDQSEVCSIVWSSVRSPQRTEGTTLQGPDQSQSWGQSQDQRQRSSGQRHRFSTQGPCSKSCRHCSKSCELRNGDE